MHILWIIAGLVLWSGLCAYAGVKYGQKLDADTRAELKQLRQRWANTIAAAKGISH